MQMKNGDEIIRQAESKCSSKYVNQLNFTLICFSAFISLSLLSAPSQFLPFFSPQPLMALLLVTSNYGLSICFVLGDVKTQYIHIVLMGICIRFVISCAVLDCGRKMEGYAHIQTNMDPCHSWKMV